MTTLQPSRRHTLAGLAAVLSGLAVLYRFPPDRYGFYPRCPIHQFTGLLCPGCGATRAIAALLHGDVVQALHWNALVVALLPALLGCALVAWLRAVRGDATVWPTLGNRSFAALLATTAAFTVLRNLS
jgi:hypothetical protein